MYPGSRSTWRSQDAKEPTPMRITEHLTESLKLAPVPSPWPRMILCCLSVSLPLIAGQIRGEEQSSIYGALLGFILILNDHFGPLLTRIKHLSTAFVFLAIAFILGLLVNGEPYFIYPLVFLMAFLAGKAKGFGLELERLVLFMTLQFLNGALTPGLKEYLVPLLMYASLSFVNYLICLCVVFFVLKHKANFQKSKRELLRQAISKKENQRFALTLAVASCIGLVIGNYFHLAKANWIVSSVVVVMMPTKTQSYQRSFQRIFGTIVGVICSLTVTHFAKNPIVLILFSAVASFFAPLGLIKNYWLGNAFIAGLIMFFMQFGSMEHSEFDFAYLRLMDIGIGCIIGAVATVVAFPPAKK